jgi:hypothetical protein
MIVHVQTKKRWEEGSKIEEMSAQKLSVALEEPVARAAKKSAARRGISLSAWLNEASRNALAIEDGLIAVAEWEAEQGQLSQEDLAAADAVIDSAQIAEAA